MQTWHLEANNLLADFLEAFLVGFFILLGGGEQGEEMVGDGDQAVLFSQTEEILHDGPKTEQEGDEKRPS